MSNAELILATTTMLYTPTVGQNCSENEYQCADRHCIALSAVCDQTVDCPDESDERGCNQSTKSYSQPNGTNVTESLIELDLDVICTKNEFTCRNGQCIQQNLQCDGRADCSDSSDEANCRSSSMFFVYSYY